MAARRIPLVVVLGATGAGKSKLAIEIAKVFSGEIISADSMQIYKGLDIITNKVTEEEQRECPHHLISYLEADHKHYNIVDFRDAAVPIIDDLLKRRILPIIVGGTNYYIESVLWDFLVDKKNSTVPTSDYSKETTEQHQDLYVTNKDTQDHKSQGARTASHAPSSKSQTPQSLRKSSEELTKPEFPVMKKPKLTTDSPLRTVLDSADDATSSQKTSFGDIHTKSFKTGNPVDRLHTSDILSQNMSVNLEKYGLPEDPADTSKADPPNKTTDGQLLPKHSLSDVKVHSDSRSNFDSHAGVDQHMGLPAMDVDEVAAPVASVDTSGLSSDPEDYKDNESGLLQCLHSLSPEELYARLEQVDPETAAVQHPNNRRKIVRALQVFYQTGRKLSSILEEQHGGRAHLKSGPLRYPEPCILWVKCSQPDLNERLDNRVDEMIKRGLVAELENFHKEAERLEALKRDNREEDSGHIYPHGILQMIGFKEFHDYLQLTPEERDTEEGCKVFEKGVSELKHATRRYARQQVRWISNRFCSRPGPDVPPVYSVDSTDLSHWDKAVQEAIDVVTAFIKGEKPSKEPEPTAQKVDSQLERKVCELCGGRVFLHRHEWEGHLQSKKHKYNAKLMKKRRENLCKLLSKREEQLRARGDEGTTGETSGENEEGFSLDGGDMLWQPPSPSSSSQPSTSPSSRSPTSAPT